MKIYYRNYPMFSLCGLNCAFCPRYNNNGISKCPGCGGKDFHLKHPTCSVVTCNKKHDNVEYCFECKNYPCNKYNNISRKDSFISYSNVLSDFEKIKRIGIEQYKKEINRKTEVLELLLKKYNNGKLKSFYCNAINLLDIKNIEDLMIYISKQKNKEDIIYNIVNYINQVAKENNIDLKLRK